jgi:L-ascorbate metabolism protein UlaG (beta-lactamase superfamily)
MKIRKYPQSCFLIEANNKIILVDPGMLKFQSEFIDDWCRADMILITHKHSDHINAQVIKDLNIPIYATKEVQDTYPDIKFNIVEDGNNLVFDTLKIEVVKAVHGYNPKLKGKGEVLFNVGYIIDDGKVRFYITSDTICFNNDYKADIVALPVTGYGLTMSSYEASLFAIDLKAKLVLPSHMDNSVYPTDLKYMEKNFKEFNINYKVLDILEDIEV